MIKNIQQTKDSKIFAHKVGYLKDHDLNLYLENNKQIWSLDKTRSQFRGLNQCQSILIKYNFKNILSYEGDLNIDLEFEFINLVLNYSNLILKIIDKENILRIILAKLPPHSKINMHIDPKELTVCSRYHWVINTNDLCFAKSRNHKINFPLNEIWHFNHSELHGAENLGSTDRIHLIIDCN